MGKREKIIQAAVEVFTERGIEKTKVSDIVKVAGVAQGTFYLYFPSKFSVMPAIAEVMVEKMIAAVKEEVETQTPLSEQLKQIVDAIFQVTEEYREVTALIYAGLTTSDQITKWETIYEPIYRWMSHFLHEAKAARKIRSSVQPERTSKLVIALIESAAEQIYLYDVPDKKRATEQKNEVLLFLQHALQVHT